MSPPAHGLDVKQANAFAELLGIAREGSGARCHGCVHSCSIPDPSARKRANVGTQAVESITELRRRPSSCIIHKVGDNGQVTVPVCCYSTGVHVGVRCVLRVRLLISALKAKR